MFLFHEHIWREPILLLKAFAEIELVIETNTQGHLLAGEGGGVQQGIRFVQANTGKELNDGEARLLLESGTYIVGVCVDTKGDHIEIQLWLGIVIEKIEPYPFNQGKAPRCRVLEGFKEKGLKPCHILSKGGEPLQNP